LGGASVLKPSPAAAAPSLSLTNRFGSSSSVGASGNGADDLEELDERAVAAAKWVDKEIRKLIAQIQRLGAVGPDGKLQIKYGPLFDETTNIFEALSGTLKTAKKYKVVDYEGELLYQGASDNVVITLLKETHDGVVIKRRRKSELITGGTGSKGKAFETSSLQNQQQKCHICEKTVYPMEFVGAAGKAFHKNCFRCTVCQTILKATNYCCTDDSKFYCKTHYMALVNAGHSFDELG
jgi:hypothetical protein